MEKASRFDSAVKRFLTMADIEVIRDLIEEEEVEVLHSSWIDVSIVGTLFVLSWINANFGLCFSTQLGWP